MRKISFINTENSSVVYRSTTNIRISNLYGTENIFSLILEYPMPQGIGLVKITYNTLSQSIKVFINAHTFYGRSCKMECTEKPDLTSRLRVCNGLICPEGKKYLNKKCQEIMKNLNHSYGNG